MALTQPPFGSYPDISGVVDATAKAEITALLTELKTFMPAGEEGTSPVRSPDFDPLRPSMGEAYQLEIDGIQAAIDAAPEA